MMWTIPRKKDVESRFVVVIEMASGREMTIELIRGGLWPDDGQDPPAFIREIEDDVFENSDGTFRSIDSMASFYGCVVVDSSAVYTESN